MATVALLARAAGPGIGPGTFTSPAVARGAVASIVARLNAVDADWDSDPTLLVSFTIEYSEDGGATWRLLVGGETHGGARSTRTGALPSVGRDVPLSATHLRGTLSLSKRFRLGLDGDLI